MRYYNCVIKTNEEQIKEKAKIRLKDYAFQSSITAMNSFFYKNIENGLCFAAYREEGEATYAVFSYDDRANSYNHAYENIFGMLSEFFCVNKIIEEPSEITMYQFLDCLLEGRRREYFNGSFLRIIDTTNLWIYYDDYKNDKKSIHYVFNEKIISDNNKKSMLMYDESFKDELANIEAHKNVSEYDGNLVHYIISSRSMEAASDMVETLMQSLMKANRISGRRMEIISEIEPNFYKVDNHIEEVIENNHGGVIVFDLSEKFGFDVVEYGMASKYILNLVQKYRNDCLFVFTYNMDKPGFAYNILPYLNKYVLPVALREGKNDRKTAVNYMKSLIKNSKYSKYAGQANEFMQLFPANEFYQTDVLMAYEKFESWCINKNILQAYDNHFSDDFMLDRDNNAVSSYDKLHKMIGLEIVKEQIDSIIATNLVEKERQRRKGSNYESSTMHMIFGGNPGTAKTTVAKLFAGIAKEKGILKSGVFVERGGMDLDGLGYVTKIREAFMAAKGGVLFIDEAYSLKTDNAVTVLLQEMENRRDEVIVILAGYNARMHAFMEINEGLKSRIPYWVEFPDYNVNELMDIFKLMLNERGFTATDGALQEAYYILDKVRYTDNFGNGRYVRNLIEHALQKQSVRLLKARENVSNIRKQELFLITEQDICMLDEDLQEERATGTAQKELDDMIGLSSVKKVIRKVIASFKLKKICIEKGISKDKGSLHMVFTGNPGTAKTTVARLFAEIMKDEAVLPTGKFVEVGRGDLVGDHVGATAPLVKKKFREAQGGVLFIDEAYSLCDSYENGFGDEAINTIVQEMENHRDKVIVIFAGYPDKMKNFIDRNPGLLSRIAFQIEFEDYSTDDLCEITKLMISKKQLQITDAAMDKLKNIYESVRESNDYGNGRFVRKMLEEAEMNLAERLLHLKESELTKELITTIDESDIPAPKANTQSKKRLGFCV